MTIFPSSFWLGVIVSAVIGIVDGVIAAKA